MAINHNSTLASQGFIILPSAVNPTELLSLRSACHKARPLAESGQWPHLRTLPKQFPPWSSDPSHGIWGIQHLLHPDMPNRETFAASYFNDTIIDTTKQLLHCEDEDLVMELYNLLIRPTQNFELRWHRDDIPPSAPAEEEERRLREPAWHAQWNLALYDDDSLLVVPGSHKRARTEDERAADPYEKDMPGQMVVGLKAGDVVFYDNNILHRGVYDSGKERMTLHGSVGHVAGGRARARNVLQHGTVEWVERCGFDGLDEGMKGRAEGMRQRLVEMGRQEGGEVGFSQED
ncbi:MAG: hypothetical protein LQ338_001543 [Usnochroma carphineum]|nr:MAG: hypothetical protein LQ338_001543 [Usnochroma carphineum]